MLFTVDLGDISGLATFIPKASSEMISLLSFRFAVKSSEFVCLWSCWLIKCLFDDDLWFSQFLYKVCLNLDPWCVPGFSLLEFWNLLKYCFSDDRFSEYADLLLRHIRIQSNATYCLLLEFLDEDCFVSCFLISSSFVLIPSILYRRILMISSCPLIVFCKPNFLIMWSWCMLRLKLAEDPSPSRRELSWRVIIAALLLKSFI